MEEVKKELTRLRDRALKFCHARGCHKLEECPEGHERCKEKLGLHTSIAYETFESLRYASKIVGCVEKGKLTAGEGKRRVDNVLTGLDCLARVVERHSRSYRKLDLLLWEARECITKVYVLLKGMGQ